MAKYEIKTYYYVKECSYCEGHMDKKATEISIGKSGLNVATYSCSDCGRVYELEEYEFPHTEKEMVKIY